MNETIIIGDADPVLIDLPAGPFVRVDVTAAAGETQAKLVIDGQELSGNFALEIFDGDKVRLVASNVTAALGDGTNTLATLDGGNGFLIVRNDGIGGLIEGAVNLNVPGASLGGVFELQINTSTDPAGFSETFILGTEQIDLDLPAGPFLRVAGTGTHLDIAGQRVSGDFVIETSAAGLAVEITNGSVALGNGSSALVTATQVGTCLLYTSPSPRD